MPSESPAFCTTGKYECDEQNEQRAPTLTDALQSGMRVKDLVTLP